MKNEEVALKTEILKVVHQSRSMGHGGLYTASNDTIDRVVAVVDRIYAGFCGSDATSVGDLTEITPVLKYNKPPKKSPAKG